MRTLHLNIRTKLFVSYSLAFLLILVVIGLGIYFFLRMTITRNIESELEQSTTILRSMVETAAEVSLKNYLRAVAEKNLEIAQYYHQRRPERVVAPESHNGAHIGKRGGVR